MKREKSESLWVPLDETSTEHLDWSKSRRVSFSNLKPSMTTVSLRLPKALLARIKVEANKRDVPYQSYMKMLLAEGVQGR